MILVKTAKLIDFINYQPDQPHLSFFLRDSFPTLPQRISLAIVSLL